ncbi:MULTISPECIES: hypothetical protein [unclassified Streptomyces]|uniref:hypothetical protein n=1 Tax=unclassified Streptomyces TaxID=2593676 RepID=UPI00224CE298|nr:MULTISPECIES: hypothetical protein [unclassified Streptomyces]MCX5060491.1 hypothetical protein [Streptomyces sp. NBC_00452]MCX5293917.1 hypothetical protein [Streptomyces sp. NBC_00183]
MRGLTGAGPERARGSSQAVITVGAVFAAVALVTTACGTGGTGARDEGPAHATAVAEAVASPSPSPSGGYRRVDAVSLVKEDPKVSATVKRELKPCNADHYPVEVSYGYLTGGSVNDVLVNISSCGDFVGIATYVYRDVKGTYENVFKAEESPVYAEIDGTDLTVAKQVYDTDDPVSNPSRETVTTYRWKAGRFAQHSTHETDYSELDSGDDDTPTPAPDH